MAKYIPPTVFSIVVTVNGNTPTTDTFHGDTVMNIHRASEVTEHEEFGRRPFRRTVTVYKITQEEDL
jgi:hypothetical protein